MADWVTEDFNYTSGETLAGLGDWVRASYSNDFLFVSDAGRARKGAESSAAVYYIATDPPGNNQAAEAVVKRVSDQNNAACGPMVRVSTSTSACYHLRWNDNGDRYELYQFGPTQLLGTDDADIAVGAEATLRVQANGTDIDAYVDDVLIVHAVDATLTSGKVGIRINGNGSDTVGLHISSFRAYDLDEGGSTTVTKTSSLDAALQKLGVTRTAGVSAALQKAGLTRTASLDAALMRAAIEITAGVDAYLLGAEFTPLGVEFDGTNDYLTRASGLTGQSSNADLSLSFFIKTSQPNAEVISIVDGGSYVVRMALSSGALAFQLHALAPTDALFFSTTSTVNDGLWHHVLLHVNTNASAGNKVIEILLDGESETPTSVSDADAAFSINFSGIDGATIGAVHSFLSSKFAGCLAELWLAPGQEVDPSADIGLFLSDGLPEDLGADGATPTGTAPLVYLSYRDGGDVTDFATNRGTGGNFTITGTLTECATPPALVNTQTKTASLDVALQKLGLTVAASLDAALQKAGVRTASLDAALFKRQAVTAALDAAMMKRGTVSAGVDVVIGGEGSIAIQAAVDVALQRMGLTVTASLDAVLAKRTPVTAGVDAALEKLRGLTAGVDAALVLPGRLSAAIDVALLRSLTLGASLDAFLIEPVGDRSATPLRHGSRGYKVDQPGRSFATSGRRRGFNTIH